MADKKISALTSSSTPLAGTEVLPIVQSGSTVKVAVSDLTAGRAVAMGSGSSAGNGSAYSNFTFNSSSAGGFDLNIQTAGVGRWVVSKTATVDDFFIYRYNDAGGYAGNPLQISRSNGNVRLENNLVQGTAGNGVNFTANTPASGMTSQLLNWYEEGTWTPVGNGITFSAASGTYTRIGRLVTASFTVTFPVTANTSNAQATGLPFTAGANSAVALSGYNSDLNAQVNSATSLIYFANASGTAYKTNANLSTQLITGTVSYRV
jgi:hypothetical protein